MKNIVLYAPPGAGKGTICELLVKKYGYDVISFGQVLRDNRNPNTDIGKRIIEAQDKGLLVSDDIVVEALTSELNKRNGVTILLEGFPRSLKQARLLDTILDNYIVINLEISRDVAMKRTLGRVSCSYCNKIYNSYFEALRPKVPGICDLCGNSLDIRSDDNENSFITRFDVYDNNSKDILDYYKSMNLLYIVDASESIESVFNQVESVIKEVNL